MARRRDNPYAKPDAYSKRARGEGYPARSVYKLEEIDRRCRLLRAGQRVLDLGCAPGSWLLYAAERVGQNGRVLGVDLTPLAIGLPANATALVGDALSEEGEAAEAVSAAAPYDVLLSDMAPSTTGDRWTDQVRSAELVGRTLDLAERHVRPGGAWVAKLFMSDELPGLRRRVRALFEEERILRPEATRTISYEVFLVGLRRRAAPAVGLRRRAAPAP